MQRDHCQVSATPRPATYIADPVSGTTMNHHVPRGISAAGAPQRGFDSSHEPRRLERLAYVVVGACIHCIDLCFVPIRAGQNDDWNAGARGRRAKPAEHFETAEHGEIQVEYYERALFAGREMVDCRRTISYFRDSETVLLE